MKIRKYHVIFVYFCKARWARLKKRKENHVTKVTKIPKTKRQKYKDEQNINKVTTSNFQFLEKAAVQYRLIETPNDWLSENNYFLLFTTQST